MLNSIKTKLIAALAILLFIMGVIVRTLSGKNKELKRELKTKDKKIEIREDQDQAKEEVILNEKTKIENSKKDSTGSRSERLNRVLNDTSDS